MCESVVRFCGGRESVNGSEGRGAVFKKKQPGNEGSVSRNTDQENNMTIPLSKIILTVPLYY